MITVNFTISIQSVYYVVGTLAAILTSVKIMVDLKKPVNGPSANGDNK